MILELTILDEENIIKVPTVEEIEIIIHHMKNYWKIY